MKPLSAALGCCGILQLVPLCCLTTEARWTQDLLTGPSATSRCVGVLNDCSRHFSTMACCPDGPWVGRREKWRKLRASIPLRGGEAFSGSMCNKLKARRRLLNEAQTLGPLFITAIHRANPHFPRPPVLSFLLAFRSRCCLSSPMAAVCRGPCRVHQRGLPPSSYSCLVPLKAFKGSQCCSVLASSGPEMLGYMCCEDRTVLCVY